MQNFLPINQIKCFTMMMARENNIFTYIKCTDDLSGCLFCSMTYFMGSDPFSSKVLINNSCPYRAAIWRGVFPNLSHTSMSAPVHKYISYTVWKKVLNIKHVLANHLFSSLWKGCFNSITFLTYQWYETGSNFAFEINLS